MIVPIEPAERSLHFASPQFLPDGVHFLFSADGPESVREIRLGRIDGGETRRLLQNASGAVYSKGRILFARGGSLLVSSRSTSAVPS